ncbi:uncharacterized protein MONOS_8671 [Monocercomonoides exilis]|uniref:uncharacterized protein n=1 Tax=Monocercomonoides exilis TaxID=2049356 RepID=UPI00355A83E0|nr:hypothetical protein MONOS_8671 [Monocercomonoides exilis]|eukprot:MONOS_8671.1-p1 / transcript=MONOS_8671.1 / gene=MONOS_8671 / organism=Monocercomonoides_exilis_PA203 / gene_product=unspecified product / transcript_product=unspecified product / location=Mono_scaffold00333:39997-41955(-) / protein_length=450 / sequence_SO=supercontig / SO=protein_coding / is_pseudo=false
MLFWILALFGCLQKFLPNNEAFSHVFVFCRQYRSPLLHSPLRISHFGTTNQSLADRGLLSENSTITVESILGNANIVQKPSKKANFNGTIGVIIQPESKGFEFSLIAIKKLDYIFPNWYTVNLDEDVEVYADKSLNSSWVSAVKTASENLKESKDSTLVIPSFSFTGWSQWDLQEFLHVKGNVKEFINLVLVECESKKYDGILLNFDTLHSETIRMTQDKQAIGKWARSLHAFIRQISQELKKRSLKLFVTTTPLTVSLGNVYLIPPSLMLTTLNEKLIDGVIIVGKEKRKCTRSCNYTPRFIDTSLSQILTHFPELGQELPNAFSSSSFRKNLIQPDEQISSEMKKTVLPNIFVSLSTIGNEILDGRYKGDVSGKRYLSILSTHKTHLEWDEHCDELDITYSDSVRTHDLFYPTLKGLKHRIDVIDNYGANVVFENFGDGLLYFMDLT